MSDKKINDNQWHIVIFKRQGNHGELIVDEESAVGGYSLGHTTSVSVNPPFFVGGILPEIINIVYTNIVRARFLISLVLTFTRLQLQEHDKSEFRIDFQGLNKTFNGCLGNFMMNGQVVGEPSEKIGVIPCSKRVEPGLFFYPGNGSNYFKAGEEVDRNKIYIKCHSITKIPNVGDSCHTITS